MAIQSRQLSHRDEELLSLRLCDLPVKITAPPLQRCVNELLSELRGTCLRFRPYFWLSDGWFTPDDTGGIAIPFYLAHPRLRELERSQMLDVEGGTFDWCMRLLRHETGHAIDNVYQLHKRRDYRKLFGDYHKKYPETYRPRPYSKDFVVHLDMWYAQAHPAEDFAETFAVWLNPRSHWRRAYHDWPAMKRLELVDAMMREIAKRQQIIRTREKYKPLRALRTTLAQHYEQKRRFYVRDHPHFYERDLRRIFSDEAKYARNKSAERFIQSVRQRVRERVSRWTGESALTIDATLVDIQIAARRLQLHLYKPPAETETDLITMIAVQTMNYLNDGKHRVVV